MALFHLTSHFARFGLAAATALAAHSASAAPIVSWDYYVESNFVTTDGATSWNGQTSSAASGCEAVTSLLLLWGACSRDLTPATTAGPGVSSIEIANNTSASSTGTVLTNGAVVPAGTYTHYNNVTDGNHATLTSAMISATLFLRASDPTNSTPYATASTTYQIRFKETSNTADSCVVASGDKPCADIWVLSDALNASFRLGSELYYVSFYAAPALESLSPAACAATDSPAGCVGFTTHEGDNTPVQFLMQLTSAPLQVPGEVPEPASIALVGASLLGLVASHRRQRAQRKA